MTATATQPTLIPEPLTQADIAVALAQVRPASDPGTTEDGTRVHVHYESFGKATDKAKQAAQRAAELGLPRDRYTGRISRVWKSGAGDLIVNLYVELERDHQYRSLNVTKGKVFKFVVMGD